MVDDPPRRLVWATEPDRPEVHLPESVVDLLEADVQLGEDVAHVHPPAAPANAAVATHAPHFIMPRIRDRQERGGVRPQGRLVQTCGQALAEGFVPPLRVVALAEPVKAALLGRQRAPRRSRGLGLPSSTSLSASPRPADEGGKRPPASTPGGRSAWQAPAEASGSGGRATPRTCNKWLRGALPRE